MSQSAEITELQVVEEGGVTLVEGVPGARFMTSPKDVDRVLEACFSARTGGVLLYTANLTEGFFDLSSGEAGAFLQKLVNYHIRLAVVWTPGDVAWSSRFGEMVAEEQQGASFSVFPTREAARAWLASFEEPSG